MYAVFKSSLKKLVLSFLFLLNEKNIWLVIIFRTKKSLSKDKISAKENDVMT